MGFLDRLSSTKRPQPGTTVLPASQVRAALLSLNRASAPYRIVDGTSEGVDLIAEWRIVDAQWYEIFAKAGLSKVFRIYMKLDEMNHSVRTLDREYSVSWSAGVPSLSLSATAFKGQMQSVEFSTAYAFTEELEPSQVYKYRFDTREIKGPLQEAVTRCGWTYQGVAFGKL